MSFQAGAPHNASVPITVAPSGVPYSVKVIMTSDQQGQNVAATSNTANATATGSPQTQTVTITAPNAIGTFYPFVIVTVAGVEYVSAQAAVVTTPLVTIGTITWG